MTTEEGEKLISMIRSVFSNAPRPNKITVCPCDECRELQIFFSDPESDLSTAWELQQHETILFHATAEAFRYFLPMYMIVSLENLSNSGAIPDLILSSISTDRDRQERLSLFSDLEIDCVEKFINFLVDSGEYNDADLDAARMAITLHKLSNKSR